MEEGACTAGTAEGDDGRGQQSQQVDATQGTTLQQGFDINIFLQRTLSNFQSSEQKTAKKHSKHARINNHSTSTDSCSKDATPLLAGLSYCHSNMLEYSASNQPSALLSSSRHSLASDHSANNKPTMCRICHLVSDSSANPVISPCRCNGTMRYVHTACLVHWLEISTKKMCPAPRCELCGYNYKTHPYFFNLQRLHFPQLIPRDRALHLIFVIVLTVMIGCATLSVMYLQGDPYGTRKYRASLTLEDVIVIVCSILFFCAFFVAIFTQYRADSSLCRVLMRCWLINRNWRIRNYDIDDDPEIVWIKAGMRSP